MNVDSTCGFNCLKSHEASTSKYTLEDRMILKGKLFISVLSCVLIVKENT